MVQKGSGTSHAKIILIGEHSVVYGQPAIALPLSRVMCNVTILETQSGGQRIDSRYFDGPVNQLPETMAGIATLIQKLTAYFNGYDDTWLMQITSMLPAERGMGSSAATAVAITKAFFDYYGRAVSREQLLAFADIEEQITHRSPSGLDAATVSSDSPIWYVKNSQTVPLQMNIDATLLIVDTGVEGRTKEAINTVKYQLEVNQLITMQRIEQLGKLVRETKSCLQRGDITKLGKCLTAAQQQLSALSVSHPSLDELIDLAMLNGALGAKLTGGGRGGCLIALMDNETAAKKLATKMVSAGASATWIQPLSGGLEA